MKNYIYLSLLLICISTNAQINVVAKVPEVDSIFSPKLTGESFYENKNYIGDQYFNIDWADGDLLLSTGEMIYGKYLKYNGLFDELIWLNSNNFGAFKLDKSSIAEFWLRNIVGADIHFKQINVSEIGNIKPQDIFAEVKVEGNFSFYIQHKISITGTENIIKNEVFCQFNNIDATPVYYIKLPTNNYLKMTKLRRRTFLKFFPTKKNVILKIIKDNNLNVKEESGFVKLIELMNKEVFL